MNKGSMGEECILALKSITKPKLELLTHLVQKTVHQDVQFLQKIPLSIIFQMAPCQILEKFVALMAAEL